MTHECPNCGNEGKMKGPTEMMQDDADYSFNYKSGKAVCEDCGEKFETA